MKYGFFPYTNDESATCWNTPTIQLDHIPTEITQPIMAEIVYHMAEEQVPRPSLEECQRMTMEELSYYVPDRLYLTMTKLAVIPKDQWQLVKEIGDALLETMTDDSSCYEAASEFAGILESKSVAVLDFPN